MSQDATPNSGPPFHIRVLNSCRFLDVWRVAREFGIALVMPTDFLIAGPQCEYQHSFEVEFMLTAECASPSAFAEPSGKSCIAHKFALFEGSDNIRDLARAVDNMQCCAFACSRSQTYMYIRNQCTTLCLKFSS